MDTHTLVVMNVLLYVLYAGVIALNARMLGSAKGAAWFAGANLSRGGALLLILLGGIVPVTEALSGLLAVLGMMMLHFSFDELLERGPLMRSLQYVLVGGMAVGTIYLLIEPSHYPAALLLSFATESVQVAATAAVVFLFVGEDIGLAASLTGVSLAIYAVLLLLRVMASLKFGTPDYPALASEMRRFWLVGTLVTNSAIVFGFMFLSAAKLRVELLWHAQVDELTGLLNRWALTRIAMREIARCGRTKGTIAVVMMDLDGLKQVNDSLGHACGDAVLQAVGRALQETVRGQDAVARMGGDEFCILLPDTGSVEAGMAAERMRSRVDDLCVQYRGETVRVRASLGVASSEGCGQSWQSLVEQSDAALYRAKRGGRNRVVAAEQLEELGNEGAF
ncbi:MULTISPECIES: GGDEF domain-containing protein [Acidobacteriaceae]|uniref:GGDEF domain-containing protein n=1 Tax=Acidobacteriaceae TaxID=204434 RepID=UPI00131E36CE|nr:MULTISPECIES: GGDEF domain-containing protein [Acidobacteriaceae]MDW5267161.1 GGDEF domain-containing protein [Edaphobacter sp.]